MVTDLELPSDDPEHLLDLARTRNWSPSVLFVDTEDTFPLNITAATDKLGHMNLMPVHGLNVHSMIKHQTLVLTKRAVEVSCILMMQHHYKIFCRGSLTNFCLHFTEKISQTLLLKVQWVPLS